MGGFPTRRRIDTFSPLGVPSPAFHAPVSITPATYPPAAPDFPGSRAPAQLTILRRLARGHRQTPLAVALLAAVWLLAPDPLQGQEARYRIQGRVTDARTADPLAGVSVLIRGTSLGALTDRAGNYAIAASLPTGSYTLEYSFLGRRNY